MASVFENNYYITLSTHAKHIDDAMKLFEGAVGHLKSLLRITSYNVCYTKLLRDNAENIEACIAEIKSIFAEPEEGTTYEGKVVNVQKFGAFVNRNNFV